MKPSGSYILTIIASVLVLMLSACSFTPDRPDLLEKGDAPEEFSFSGMADARSDWWRAFGDYAVEYWIMVVCNTVAPLFFLFKKVRADIRWLFVISILVNIGMWFERFVIIAGSVAHDFLPHAWGLYTPTLIEFGIMIGAFCLFFFLFLLFVKHLPSVSMTEMKETLHHGASHDG